MTVGGPNPWMVINALDQQFDVHVLMEEPESKAGIFRRRERRLGTVQAVGQLATMAAAKMIRWAARHRTEEICSLYGADPRFNPSVNVTTVRSINSPETLEIVQQVNPAAILLVSTRLMKRDILSALTVPVLNLHAGINPAYRGQMGGYWALVRGDRENFGATVHLVDAGTDTGATLYQVRAVPSASDCISTYPMLLTAAALEITCRAVEDAANGRLQPIAPSGPSELHFPPTLWRWLWNGVRRRIL
ncbi:MAG TPA: formyl transferase [Rhizobium sp.]|nr:formyl transferase [Rhizobium sp.]